MRTILWLAFGAAIARAMRADFLYTFNVTNGGGGRLFYFAPGSFATVGTYATTLLHGINDGSLSVAASGSLPEPQSILLFGTVACFLEGIRRRFKLGARSCKSE